MMTPTLPNWKARDLATGAGMFSRGMKMSDVAKRLGYGKRAFQKLRQNNPDIWEAGMRAAMQRASERVTRMAAKAAARGDFDDGNAVRWLCQQDAGSEPTLRDILADYLLTHDLSGGSPQQYGAIVSVVESWYGGPVPAKEFTVNLCNQFLLAKKEAGLAAYSRKSYRGTLRAFLNHVGQEGKLRPVKFERPDPQVWTPEEVDRLIAAAPTKEWRLRIMLAYYTGLNAVDLRLIERRNIVDGVLRWRRTKTGKLVVIQIPQLLLDLLPAKGLICPWNKTGEYMRRQFRAILAAAELKGSFKTLRKTSGTIVESLHPGAGHLHLGNTRQVFELHYMNSERGLVPMSPSPLNAKLVNAPFAPPPEPRPKIPKVRIASNRGRLQIRYTCPVEGREIRIPANTSDRAKAEVMRQELAAELRQTFGGGAT